MVARPSAHRIVTRLQGRTFSGNDDGPMSRPVRKRQNYLKDTAIISRIIAATQLDDDRKEVWREKVLLAGQRLIALLNEGEGIGDKARGKDH